MTGEFLGTLGYKALQFFQYIFIPTFFVMFTWGIITFLIARKNPTRKRKGYLLTVFGGIGILFVLYAPVFGMFYWSSGIDTQSILNASTPINEIIYNIFLAIVEPILLFLTYMGVGYLLLAAKEPTRKRLGLLLIIGAPFTWFCLHYAIEIYTFFSGI
ncbi:hypothetical protein QTG56_23890 (plasmid) [Rossellomorea sp. AcN35-11]|nr:hypothetical protein [Rossellomorea aquimaris]WJV32404.1 hypothetical protein QTG56_23890 [Rossellomorea sp. AcN35-11]